MEANGDLTLGILSPFSDAEVSSNFSLQYDSLSIDEIDNLLAMTDDIVQAADGTSVMTPPANSPGNADISSGISYPMPLPSSPANSVLSPGNAGAANGVAIHVPPASSSARNMVLSPESANVANRMPPASFFGTNVALPPGYADVSNRIPCVMLPANSSGASPGNANMFNGISFPMTTASSSGTNITQSPWNAELADRISFGMPPASSPANAGYPPASANASNGVPFVMSRGIPPLRRLVHGPAWSIDWSRHEQATLNRGLQEFATDPVITKYAKIAARLPSKTVRDVAMRCYWMKERLASSSLGAHNHHLIQSASPSSRPMMHDSHTNERLSSSSLGVCNNQQSAGPSSQSVLHNLAINQYEPLSSEVWRLLEENNIILAHIAGNIGTAQMQYNAGLFNLVGSTIGTMLLGMEGANLPPLPVSMNLDLFNTMWPNLSTQENSSSNPNPSEVPRRHSG